MSKPVLPPPVGIQLFLEPPEELRDKSPEHIYSWLMERQTKFLFLVANQISKGFTSKPAEFAFQNQAKDQANMDAAISAQVKDALKR